MDAKAVIEIIVDKAIYFITRRLAKNFNRDTQNSIKLRATSRFSL
jgi:hypothetical protein